MDLEQLRELCLAFPGAVETFPFSAGTPVYKVAGKIFALSLQREPLTVNLKCEPGLSQQLRDAHPEIAPGYHMNKRHWVSVTIEGGSLTEQMIRDLVEDSYDLIVASLPATRRQALRWRGEPAA